MQNEAYSLAAIIALLMLGCGERGRTTKVQDSHSTGEANQLVHAPGLPETITRYAGTDMKKLPQGEVDKFYDELNKLVPARATIIRDVRPRYVWLLRDEAGHPTYTIFEVEDMGTHPGSNGIWLTVVDDRGKLIAESYFTTGHRCYFRGVKLETTLVNGDYPWVVLQTDLGAGPGPDIAGQYYARFGNRFDLVRVENHRGKAGRNDYEHSANACGPRVPKQTEKDWEADIFSNDRTKILRALVWLGGIHWNPNTKVERKRWTESREDAVLVYDLRTNPKIRAHLMELEKHHDRFISEQASVVVNEAVDK